MSKVVALGREVARAEAAAYVPPQLRPAESAEQPETAAKAANAHEERMCEGLGQEEFVQGCKDVAQVYGLENLSPIAASAPDLICEQLMSCRMLAKSAKVGQHKLLSHEQVVSVLTDAIASPEAANAEEEVHGDVLVSKEAGASGQLMSMMSSLFKMRMQSQMMMQAMQMRQTLMENEHKMMEKIMRAMARNRAIRCELKHLKKMAYRAQPGNCDCCDGCLPPKKGGKGKGGKGKKGRK